MGILLPHNFVPRPYQLPVLEALDGGIKRAVCPWHRRAGKEKTFLNYVVKFLMTRRGLGLYLFPTFKQAKKVIWDGMDREGFPFMSHFPPGIVKGKNETELKLTLTNDSIFQLGGTDTFDAWMGLILLSWCSRSIRFKTRKHG